MPSTVSPPAERTISFGRFVLFPKKRTLLESGKPVRLGTRALDILTALVEHAGELVTKEQLVASAWPDTVVHEGNLKVHIAAIRRVLADGRNDQRYVVNAAGRGYRFVAAVSSGEVALEVPSSGRPARSIRSGFLTRVFGRSDVIDSIAVLLSERRLVTIAGPGGIGKTTVAQAIALAGDAAEARPIFADLAPLSDPLLLPSSIAALLGLAVRSDNPLPDLIRFLGDKRVLIVLDSCEHMLKAVAGLAESLLAGAPGLRLLATSREPLRAAEEVVRRLPPLDTPSESDAQTAERAGRFSAVELFVERARASCDTFELTDADAPFVGEICRKLDGNALAIELAAGRVDSFGVRGVASSLDDRLNLLRGGKRTALPRHQGLRAALDWSHDLLADDERVVLRRLSVFVGTFTLDSAKAIASEKDSGASDVAHCVANLVAKSLVSTETVAGRSRYRLLDTMGAYAREKLLAAGELDEYSERHAQHFRELLERTAVGFKAPDAVTWLSEHGVQLDDIRRALDWSFSPAGRWTLGVAVTIAAVPVWLNLSLMDECQQRVRQALSRVAGTEVEPEVWRMQLYAALGVALYSIGSGAEAKAAWEQVLVRADRSRNSDFKLRALWGLWTVCVNGGDHRTGLGLAEDFARVAEQASDADALLVSDRLVGISHHFLGEHATARRHIERMLGRSRPGSGMTDIARFQLDQSMASRAYLAKILWIQGYPDQAASLVERSLADALTLDHSLSICYCLGQSGCPIAFLNGDLAAAERYIALLLEHSSKCRLALWSTMARGFQGILLVRRSDPDQGVKRLQESTDELRGSSLAHCHTAFLSELARGLGQTGRMTLGLEAIEAALVRSSRDNERWCLPELIRIQAELQLLEGGAKATGRAEAGLRESLELAHRQGALSWELRTASSLVRLQSSKGRAHQYRELLETLWGRFREGFGTADLRAAKRLLASNGQRVSV